MYNIFPKELWVNIILETSYKDIVNISNINDQFSILCNSENLFHRRKMKGFPRKSGQCKYHDASKFSGSFYNAEKILITGHFVNILRNRKHDDIKTSCLVLNATLNKLYENNTDLVAGDMINFDDVNGTFLFDGESIIHMDKAWLESNRIMPSILCPIKNNVPIKYWTDVKLSHARFIFNIKNIRKELINNISHNQNDIIYTWFILNNISYGIYRYFDNEFLDSLSNEDEIYMYLINNSCSTFSAKNVIIENVYNMTSYFMCINF